MELTDELKIQIESKSIYDLLFRNRFAPDNDEMMQGESGKFWLETLAKKRAENPGEYVAASKHMGWE